MNTQIKDETIKKILKEGITDIKVLKEIEDFAKYLTEEEKNENSSQADNFKKTNKKNDLTTKSLTTSQLRKFFNFLKTLESRIITLDKPNDEIKKKILKLKIYLSYSVGKEDKKSKLKDLSDLIGKVINMLIDDKELSANKNCYLHFLNTMEAIVAYHKFYEKNKVEKTY